MSSFFLQSMVVFEVSSSENHLSAGLLSITRQLIPTVSDFITIISDLRVGFPAGNIY